MKKIFDALVDGSVALISRFLPDAYILVLLLTVILFVVAVPVTGIAPAEGITVADRLVNLVYDGWYGGFWNLLGFGMQMVLIVVTGTMFANTEPVHRIIVKIASIPKTPRQALLLVSAVGMVAYFLQWGAALIVCAVLAQEVAKQVKGLHYPLLVAAAYVGNAFCLVGISGTIALNVAGGWTFDGVWSTTGIPFRETVFAPYNLFIYLVGAIVLCLLITAMHPSPEKTKTVDPAIFAEETVEKQYRPRSEMAPEDYKVGEILRLTEGSLAPVSCLEAGAKLCEIAPHCRTLPMWTRLNSVINEFFDSYTIADLMKTEDGGDYVI